MKFDLPPGTQVSEQIVTATAAHEEKKLQRGWLGAVFGLGEEKPGNIIGFILIVLLLLFSGVALFGTDTPSFTKKDEFLAIGAMITSVLSFLIGRSTAP